MKVRIYLKLGWDCGDNCCYDYEYENEVIEMTEQEFKAVEKQLEDCNEWDNVPVEQVNVPDFWNRVYSLGENNENEYNYLTHIERVRE